MNYGLPWRRLCVFCLLQIEAAVAGQACFDHNQEHIVSHVLAPKPKVLVSKLRDAVKHVLADFVR